MRCCRKARPFGPPLCHHAARHHRPTRSRCALLLKHRPDIRPPARRFLECEMNLPGSSAAGAARFNGTVPAHNCFWPIAFLPRPELRGDARTTRFGNLPFISTSTISCFKTSQFAGNRPSGSPRGPPAPQRQDWKTLLSAGLISNPLTASTPQFVSGGSADPRPNPAPTLTRRRKLAANHSMAVFRAVFGLGVERFIPGFAPQKRRFCA